MKKYRTRYETVLLTESEVIKPNGANSIVFKNLGDTKASILNDIPLEAHVDDSEYYDEFAFINKPNIMIDQSIPVLFLPDGTETDPLILVIKSYIYE